MSREAHRVGNTYRLYSNTCGLYLTEPATREELEALTHPSTDQATLTRWLDVATEMDEWDWEGD